MSLKQAKEKLLNGDFTCVLCKDKVYFTSKKRGVKPLFDFLNSNIDFCGFSAADKVIGKATAFLYVKIGIKEVYTTVISRPALSVFASNRIEVEYDTLVDNIVNRNGDGICPFEKVVLNTDNVNNAYQRIILKLKEMGLYDEVR